MPCRLVYKYQCSGQRVTSVFRIVQNSTSWISLKMQVTKTLVKTEFSTWPHIPEGLNLHQHIRENMKSNKATDSTLPKSV